METDGLGEGFDAVVGVAAEPAAPGFLLTAYSQRRCAATREGSASAIRWRIAVNRKLDPSSFSCLASTGVGARSSGRAPLVLREGDHVADFVGAGQHHRPAVQAEASRHAAAHLLQRVEQEAEARRACSWFMPSTLNTAIALPDCGYECCRRRTS